MAAMHSQFFNKNIKAPPLLLAEGAPYLSAIIFYYHKTTYRVIRIIFDMITMYYMVQLMMCYVQNNYLKL